MCGCVGSLAKLDGVPFERVGSLERVSGRPVGVSDRLLLSQSLHERVGSLERVSRRPLGVSDRLVLPRSQNECVGSLVACAFSTNERNLL